MSRKSQNLFHISITFTILFMICFSITNSQRTPAAKDDQVTQLDGYYDFSKDFQMYSGYLDLQLDAGKQISIHYVFITSMNKPDTDDLVMWFNGGPGCSSLLGFAQQVGPNMLLSGSKSFTKTKNPYSWNQISNMLYFQSPAGVGFSINKDKSYIYNDSRTAQDSLQALKLWYQRFPQFKKNNLWISGQSYCGMYIPNFANQILKYPQNEINLKGILVGNGAMKMDWNWRRKVGDQFYQSHYFYGPQITKLLGNCNYDDNDDQIPSCARGMSLADRAVDLVNPYATTGICYTPPSDSITNLNRKRFWYVPFHQKNNKKLSQIKSGPNSPCTDDAGITQYFNKPIVQTQLHIRGQVNWSPCSDFVGQNYHMDFTSLKYFQNFKKNGLKVLLYSGNTDGVVPYVQTEAYIKEIGWKQTQKKIPFINGKDSLLGWTTQYDGLTFVVINGAGHMVPSDKPHAAYQMFKAFLSYHGSVNISTQKVQQPQIKIE